MEFDIVIDIAVTSFSILLFTAPQSPPHHHHHACISHLFLLCCFPWGDRLARSWGHVLNTRGKAQHCACLALGSDHFFSTQRGTEPKHRASRPQKPHYSFIPAQVSQLLISILENQGFLRRLAYVPYGGPEALAATSVKDSLHHVLRLQTTAGTPLQQALSMFWLFKCHCLHIMCSSSVEVQTSLRRQAWPRFSHSF